MLIKLYPRPNINSKFINIDQTVSTS